MENNILEEGRGFRQKKSRMDPPCCPICGVTIRASEMDQHFAIEVERLDKLSYGHNRSKPRLESPTNGPHTSSSSSCSSISFSNKNGASTSSPNDNAETPSINADECWGTYQKIKTNRQARLKIKSRKRKAEDTVCPVCNKKPTEEITIHVEKCLKNSENKTNGDKNSDSDDDDESIDVEGENFEEYEWAGQTRVRASSLLPGGYVSAGVGTTISNADTDDELNVDGDDSQIYGPPQYSERDVVVPLIKDEKDNSYLRNLVIGNEPINIKRPAEDNENAGEGTSNCLRSETVILEHKNHIEKNGEKNSGQIIDSLKSKIREYESYIQNKPKCLICMDDFKKPVVSICCWHVYCEECWLHTLGAKKLCPQCSMITSPSDLRRIFIN